MLRNLERARTTGPSTEAVESELVRPRDRLKKHAHQGPHTGKRAVTRCYKYTMLVPVSGARCCFRSPGEASLRRVTRGRIPNEVGFGMDSRRQQVHQLHGTQLDQNRKAGLFLSPPTNQPSTSHPALLDLFMFIHTSLKRILLSHVSPTGRRRYRHRVPVPTAVRSLTSKPVDRTSSGPSGKWGTPPSPPRIPEPGPINMRPTRSKGRCGSGRGEEGFEEANRTRIVF